MVTKLTILISIGLIIVSLILDTLLEWKMHTIP